MTPPKKTSGFSDGLSKIAYLWLFIFMIPMLPFLKKANAGPFYSNYKEVQACCLFCSNMKVQLCKKFEYNTNKRGRKTDSG